LLINVSNYSTLRLDIRDVGYFGLCWLLDIRCYYGHVCHYQGLTG